MTINNITNKETRYSQWTKQNLRYHKKILETELERVKHALEIINSAIKIVEKYGKK